MRKRYIILSLINTLLLQAQDNKKNPEIFPPAPTSNNLMKFEEVPVSFYTGVPNISIPIYNLKTKSLTIPVSLEYHTHNIKPKDRASEVGLGWSLNAGGSITRTVRDVPDENDFMPSTLGGERRVGIYSDEHTNRSVDKNYAAKFISLFESNNTSQLTSTENNELYNKFIYEGYFKGKFDKEYDLYQYNFLGYAGRFIIKKDTNNQFNVEKLDLNNLKIKCNVDPSTFIAESFEITDEQGRNYIFSIQEKNDLTYTKESIALNGDVGTSFSLGALIVSTYHISEIKENNNVIAEFNYLDSKEIFYTDNSKIERRNISNHNGSGIDSQILAQLPLKEELTIVNNKIQTRLLDNISIKGHGKIQFNYEYGRQDTDYTGNNQMYKLKSISQFNSSNTELSRYEFNYNYFRYRNFLDKVKLKLTDIKHFSNTNEINNYKFDYNEISNINLGIDKWGWANCTDNQFDREPNVNCMSANVLKAIKLPTDGVQSFDFGPNTYSYDYRGDLEENTEEKTVGIGEYILNKTNISNFKDLFYLDYDQEVSFEIYANGLDGGIPWSIKLYKDGNLINNKIGNSIGDSNYNTNPSLFLTKGNYTAKLEIVQPGFNYTQNINLYASAKRNVPTGIKYNIGGGIRINSISYFDSYNQYKVNTNPIRKINYQYHNENTQLSNGSLSFPVPLNNYFYQFNTFVYVTDGISTGAVKTSYAYEIYNTDNFLPVQKTKGSDVGYSMVKISESNSEESIVYTKKYTSPESDPNPDLVNTRPPFLPITNHDYKRGLNILDTKYNNTNKVQETISDYKLINNKKITGLKMIFEYDPDFTYLGAGQLNSYEKYKSFCSNIPVSVYCFGLEIPSLNKPIDFLYTLPIEEVVGIALPSKNETTEYLDEGNVTNTSITEYNGRNILLPTKQSTKNSKGENVITEYLYPSDLINQSNYSILDKELLSRLITENRISEPVVIKQKVAGNYVSEVYNQYSKFNGIIQKSAVFQKKGSGIDITKITDRVIKYDSYDNKGNLTQYTPENGIPVSIIWGYNGQYPVAKIEGSIYTDVVSKLSSYLTKIQNGTLTATEENTIRGLIPTSMITTYQYKPLIGVNKIVKPNGLSENYKYDSANRLEEIRNDKGELLKSFKYNYKQ